MGPSRNWGRVFHAGTKKNLIMGLLRMHSVLGHIPGFQALVFPTARLNLLNIVANLGLVLFLFTIGLELDLTYFKKNARNSIFISICGMILPFGLGCAVSVFLYNNINVDPAPPFASFILFIGVALSITAFPVLARILVETKMLDSSIGITVISAAAIDDSTAWCLLALVIAIIVSKTMLNILYVFLLLAAFILLMVGGVFF